MTRFSYDKVLGSLLGGALGDALGRDSEFMTLRQIYARYGRTGYVRLPNPALVTDDTQMTIAAGEALVRARSLRPKTLAAHLSREYVRWADVEPRRAPGRTCMSAVALLRRGNRWQDASQVRSKGCGANMRVAALALGVDDEVTACGLAQLSAAITHGHPTALAAAELTALAVRWFAEGREPRQVVADLLRHARRAERYGRYDRRWLGRLAERRWPAALGATQVMRLGWRECVRSLKILGRALDSGRTLEDPCSALGGAWVAEEALVVALYVAVHYDTNPQLALAAAARTSGDSDSIGAIAGNLVGARWGVAAWPTDWTRRVEYRERITRLAVDLVGEPVTHMA